MVLIIGLFEVVTGELLPLTSCTVKAEIQNYIVGLKSTLKYFNGGDKPVEVQFRFPVEESYAVVGMEAVIEGRTIKAEIKKKEEAKKDYKEAIASGHTAALAEEQSGDIFSISLGNLSAGSEAELHLKLVGELPIDAEGGVRFTLPAVLKPRYTPEGSVDPLAPAAGANKGEAPAVYDFKMTLKSDEVADVTSPTHAISVDKDVDKVSVSLNGEDAQPLKKDLVVLISHKDPHVPKVVYELGDPTKSQRSYMGAPAVMLSFFPEFEVKRAACEFIFLVDRSGSMRGSYIKSANETLVLFLKSIPPGCSFNIIGFGSSYTSLFPESVSYNQESLEDAIRHAESLQADLGGTELLNPLRHIFDQRLLPGLPRQMFILTDGSVSNTQLCVDMVKKNVHKCRVFTFGIGSGASTALVNGIAKAGNGTSEFIKEGERMQPKIVSSMKKALQPTVADLKVKFELPPNIEVIQAPTSIHSIYSGEKIVVFGLLKPKITSDSAPVCSGVTGHATLSGRILDKKITFSMPVDIPPAAQLGRKRLRAPVEYELPLIHQLAAKNILKEWSMSDSTTSSDHSTKSINLSVDSGVVSEHTAFVAVGENSLPVSNVITVFDISATLTNSYCLPSFSGSCAFGSLGQFSHRKGGRVKQTARKSIGGKAPRMAAKKKCAKKPIAKGKRSQQRFKNPGGAPRSTTAPSVKTKAKSLSGLELLVSLQHSSGYWPLKTLCDKILKKCDVEVKCPPKVLPNIWATVIALLLLKKQYTEQKDEWELVAIKAESWLNDQPLPMDITISSIEKKAEKIVKR